MHGAIVIEINQAEPLGCHFCQNDNIAVAVMLSIDGLYYDLLICPDCINRWAAELQDHQHKLWVNQVKGE